MCGGAAGAYHRRIAEDTAARPISDPHRTLIIRVGLCGCLWCEWPVSPEQHVRGHRAGGQVAGLVRLGDAQDDATCELEWRDMSRRDHEPTVETDRAHMARELICWL